MKYIIERTSNWEGKPIDECTKMKVHKYDYRNLCVKDHKLFWEDFCKCNRDIQIFDDCYRGTHIEAKDVWVAEVNDLHEFVNQYGDIILSEPDNEEGLWRIEIYDDYRE